jgi:L-threonylcarbamoyladenylate synthase
MKTEVIKATHPVAMRHAVDVLLHGGLVVFPTDTVYGLAVLPFNEEYIERLYIVKGRDSTRAIAVLISEVNDLDKVSNTPGDIARRLAEKFWPGPLTIVVKRNPDLPEALSPNQTIGVRVPDHPVAMKLLQLTGPLAVTSANLSGSANTHTANDALAQLDGRVHLVIDGGTSPGGIPSTVVDCTKSELVILRQGPIVKEELYAAVYTK